MTRLAASTLAEVAQRLPVPEYRRDRVGSGIVHIGVGGFHRSHLAMYVDRLLAAGDHEARSWGITGVGLLPGDARMAEVMADQDCLYTLVIKHPDGSWEPRVIGSIVRYLHAPPDPEAVLEVLADPATRIVSLTITEGGYLQNQSTGEFDAQDPDVLAEIADGGPPRSVFGYLAAALDRRWKDGLDPFTVMCCDNIPGNGGVTRRTLTAFTRLTDPGLADRIEREVRFPDAMVDRITPVTTDEDRATLLERHGLADEWPVVAEPFVQWVLEDGFPLGRPDFASVGAQLVPDVEPYELMKLRLLNASHQALCYLGHLAGYRFAHEVCQDPLFADFLLAYMGAEGAPTLPPLPGVDLEAYQHQLVERFANPGIRDSLARLCAESSDRIPTWLVPVISANLAAGRDVRESALVVASWARYAQGTDEQGEPIDVVDRRRDEVMARAVPDDEDPLAFLRDPALFGDLVEQRAFTEPYLEALRSLRTRGARETLEEWGRRRSLPA